MDKYRLVKILTITLISFIIIVFVVVCTKAYQQEKIKNEDTKKGDSLVNQGTQELKGEINGWPYVITVYKYYDLTNDKIIYISATTDSKVKINVIDEFEKMPP